MVNERSQKPASQISDKVDADDWFTYFRLHSLNPITPQRVGLRSWFDFNVSNIAEFAKLNEPILDETITLEEIRKASTKLKLARQPEVIAYLMYDQIKRVHHWACIENSF